MCWGQLAEFFPLVNIGLCLVNIRYSNSKCEALKSVYEARISFTIGCETDCIVAHEKKLSV